MTTATKATKRASASTTQFSPPTAGELIPANIEQATRIDEEYVIVKLRAGRTSASAKPITVKIDSSAEYPPITANRLGELRLRLVEMPTPPNDDAENRAFLENLETQSREKRAELTRTGQLIEAKELARRLGITVQAVSKALKAKKLFDLECEGGKRLYPAFYADPELSRATLGEVTRFLDDAPGSAKWQFFTRPKLSLNRRTPLQALKEGDLNQVLFAAQGFLER